MMRIITGRAKGIKLATLEGSNTRPTSERAKEAVFSMLQFEIEGRRVLDLFSGSGQMALEALSRGADFAVMVDKSKEAIGVIEKNATKTKLKDRCRIVCEDSLSYLKKQKDCFDIVWIDPPYDSDLIQKSLTLLIEGGFLKSTSTIVCESRDEDIFKENVELKNSFELFRHAKYGIAHVTLLKPKIDKK
jgi:16S rRNA (guanine(966)-N(2))-methyltransferase RsmD